MGMDMEINKNNVEEVVITKLADKKFSLIVPVESKTSQMWAKDLLKTKADTEANLDLVNRLIEKAKEAGINFEEE